VIFSGPIKYIPEHRHVLGVHCVIVSGLMTYIPVLGVHCVIVSGLINFIQVLGIH